MSATVVAEIDLAALRHNFARVQHFAPGRRVFPAVKADAYGHGAIAVARTLAPVADAFAVARLDEALALRWAGIGNRPIILLSDPLADADISTICEHELQPLIFHASQLERLLRWSGSALKIWIKLDSGMHRLGFPVEQARALQQKVEACPGLDLAGWMTHLACADDAGSDMTHAQVARFEKATRDLPGEQSIANSAGIVNWPGSHADTVRPGIMLYGGSPMLDQTADDLGLRPVMTLSAPVISVQTLEAGETVGYGATWRAETQTTVAVIGIGYGDGYPRHAATGTPVLLNNRRCEMAGRVSMDMITVKLPDDLNVVPGDRATLWGEGLPADDVARSAGTIAYELFCRLTPRVQFRCLDTDEGSGGA